MKECNGVVKVPGDGGERFQRWISRADRISCSTAASCRLWAKTRVSAMYPKDPSWMTNSASLDQRGKRRDCCHNERQRVEKKS